MSSPVVPGKSENKDEENSESPSEIASSWNDSQENLLKGIAERCNCMRWLHTQCNQYFENLNFYFTIPNVIISTLNGSFTMSLTALFPDPNAQKGATTVIGLISIFSAVLITMNQYVKSQQMMEAHRAAGLANSKVYRTIMNELSIPRDQRSNGLEFLKFIRLEIDRLESTSPSILPSVITKFNLQFAERNIEKPEIAGDLDEVEINRQQNNFDENYKPFNKTLRHIKDISGVFLTQDAQKKEDRELTKVHVIQDNSSPRTSANNRIKNNSDV